MRSGQPSNMNDSPPLNAELNPYASPHAPTPAYLDEHGRFQGAARRVLENEIGRSANWSLGLSLAGFFVCGILLEPLAIYFGYQALRSINKYQLGHQHAVKAWIGISLGVAAILIPVVVILFLYLDPLQML